MSLGGFIRRATRSGRRITVLTVFAGLPESQTPARKWDTRAGFRTEGEATRARRLEDQEACGLLGACHAWLSFSEGPYVESRSADDVWAAAAELVQDVRGVLVPGFPLTNPDHAWLSTVLLERGLPCRRVGFYAEQPYRYTLRSHSSRLATPASIRESSGAVLEWAHIGTHPRDAWTKRRAILAYRSQMPLLGFVGHRHRKLNRMLAHEALHRGEAISWPTVR